LKVVLLNIAFSLLPLVLPAKNTFHSSPKDSGKISVLAVPTLGYAPETRGYAGAVCQLAFKTHLNTRLSSVKTELQYTQKNQSIAEISGTVFSPGEKWLFSLTGHYSRFPDFWWGNGINTPESNREPYNSRRSWFEIATLKRVRNNWFAGPVLRHQQRSHIKFEQSPSESSLKVTAVGLQCLHDGRNNLLNPQKGSYMDVQLIRNMAGDVGNGIRVTVDGRTYFKTGKNSIIAGRMAFSHLSAPTHFFDMAMLGGDKNLRGYYLGRFRDRGMLVFNSEFRATVYRRWGFALGAASGTVFTQPTDIYKNPFKPAANAGIRFLADRKAHINMRIDYAIGLKGQSGFYFAFGEAF
jgi:hypothetical protein